jgi:hypothetical protein
VEHKGQPAAYYFGFKVLHFFSSLDSGLDFFPKSPPSRPFFSSGAGSSGRIGSGSKLMSMFLKSLNTRQREMSS